MITIKRSVDFHQDVCWVAHRQEGSRCSQLYLGTDVNGAIKAATDAGLDTHEAIEMAKREISRREVNDTIRSEACPFQPH